MTIFPFLPTVIISKITGFLVELPAPRALWQIVIKIYIAFYRVNVEEAEKPVSEYQNLAQFFIRNLRPGLRPIGPGIVSPVDGMLRTCGRITREWVPQIKGRHYRYQDLVGDPEIANALAGGSYFNLYLSPKDYHHVHAPISGKIVKIVYVPGRLLPVNDASMASVDNLFGINERVTIVIAGDAGACVSLTMVAALNVGKISLTFDNELTKRIRACPWSKSGFSVEYASRQIVVEKGERIGTFHLGSSVALLIPAEVYQLSSSSDQSVAILMGQSLSELAERGV